ncbi:hypothetical protein Pcar_1710 [Syntrophotalea carbinolica DSM 2380]|uniref:VanZ-like domain-containing protein n=1 Tax=Syntrophotalea carbinolica (strain DSM 2380 / NBRC 103641 / GraBd1) TaxID=338963 RepID=Q3A3V4_SYNC1|nr:VanZ family protein [Syntrophotalea carbinolica]ABA88953.1 hypothetical protein Pcar_1710 [Syntrophotalea carbinolica DSM 2380]
MIQISVNLRLILFVAFALIILVLSLVSAPPKIIHEVLSWDKAQHAFAYAIFTLLGGWALAPLWGALRAWRRALGVAIVYGGILEGAQALSGYRVAQFADMVANSLGAVAAYLCWRAFFKFGNITSCK